MPATSVSFRQVEVAHTKECDCTQRLTAVDRKIVDFMGTVDQRVKGLERKIEEVCDTNRQTLYGLTLPAGVVRTLRELKS